MARQVTLGEKAQAAKAQIDADTNELFMLVVSARMTSEDRQRMNALLHRIRHNAGV
jgi:hypothetical protein